MRSYTNSFAYDVISEKLLIYLNIWENKIKLNKLYVQLKRF